MNNFRYKFKLIIFIYNVNHIIFKIYFKCYWENLLSMINIIISFNYYNKIEIK